MTRAYRSAPSGNQSNDSDAEREEPNAHRQAAMQKVHLKRRQASGANTPLPAVEEQGANSCGAASQINHVLVEDRDLTPDDHEVFRTAIGRAVEYATAHQGARVTALVTLSQQKLPRADAWQRVRGAIAKLQGALATAAPNADAAAMAHAAKEAGDALYDLFGFGGMQNTEAELVGQVLRGNPVAEYIKGEGPGADVMGDELMAAGMQAFDDRPKNVTFDSFEAIFENEVTRTLQPGEAAEIGWAAGNEEGSEGHYFTLGQRRSKTFYVIDQSNGFEVEAATLAELQVAVKAAIDRKACVLLGPGVPRPQSGEEPSARRLEAFGPKT